jgi:hypothetical protein
MIAPSALWGRRTAWGLLLAVHLLLAFGFLRDRSPGTDAAASGFPLDDAWIHLVYGREIANHGLPYYNTGELEAGFTSPAWLGVTAAAELANRAFGTSPVAGVKALGVAAAAAASLLVFELSLALTANLLVSLAVAGLAAATPLVAFAQLSGMEAGLATAWMLAALLALERRRHLAAGVCCALAYLTRPESIVLAPLLLLGLALAERASAPRGKAFIAGALKLLLPLAAAVGAWALYCLWVNGHPLPNTFYAKFAPVNFVANARQLVEEILLELPLAYAGVGAVVYLAGAAALARAGNGAGLAVVGVPWIFFAGVAATRGMPPGCGTYFYWWRYALPAVPLLFVPVAAGANLLWRLGGGNGPWSPRGAAGLRKMLCAAGLAVLLLVPLSRYPEQLAFRMQQFSWNCQNMNEVQVAFGRWVHATVAPGAAVVVNDAGAIRYFGERTTIDLLGLNNHQLLQKSEAFRLMGSAGALAEFMAAKRATHLIVFPSWFPALVGSPDFPARFKAQASYRSTNYTVAAAAQDVMVAFWRLP